jgi:hypothetical protein
MNRGKSTLILLVRKSAGGRYIPTFFLFSDEVKCISRIFFPLFCEKAMCRITVHFLCGFFVIIYVHVGRLHFF